MNRPLFFSILLPISAMAAMAQDPFQPLDFNAQPGTVTANSARADWVKLTNARLEMAGRPLRVALEGEASNNTAVFLLPGAQKPRHAKPYLLGKGDGEALFKSAVAMGFTRLVVRNPETRKEWAARIDKGKAILED
jgi:hypothetical protein